MVVHLRTIVLFVLFEFQVVRGGDVGDMQQSTDLFLITFSGADSASDLDFQAPVNE